MFSHMQVHTILHLLAKIQRKISKNQESICPKFGTFRSMSHFYYIDRVECFAQRDSFITLKDHKENFPNNPKCRLINPAKSEIGLISKQLLESINSEVKLKTKVNQWRQTADVIYWFKNINEKRDCRFLQLDIAEFYPSISESLLNQAIDFFK